jgi:hypothetical protein
LCIWVATSLPELSALSALIGDFTHLIKCVRCGCVCPQLQSTPHLINARVNVENVGR